MTRNFSAEPFPFSRLPKRSRRQAALESTVAKWLTVRPNGERLSKLVGGSVHVTIVPASAFDPFAASCEVRVAGAAFEVRGSSGAIRRIAQHLLGGPDELAAARPLTVIERAIWSLVVATAVEDL